MSNCHPCLQQIYYKIVSLNCNGLKSNNLLCLCLQQQQNQNLQNQQNQQNQQSFNKSSYQQSSSSNQQWSSSSSSNQQQQYKQDGSLHVDTNTQPRMMLQNARSPSSPGR